MRFNITACLWTDHFILLKALDHLFLAKQRKTCRSDQVQGSKGQVLTGSAQGKVPREFAALRAAGAVTELFWGQFLTEGNGGWWHWVRNICTLAGQPKAPSDTSTSERAGAPALYLFTFFCDNQSLTTAGAETPGQVNNCYKGLSKGTKQSQALAWHPVYWPAQDCIDQQHVGWLVGWLVGGFLTICTFKTKEQGNMFHG